MNWLPNNCMNAGAVRGVDTLPSAPHSMNELVACSASQRLPPATNSLSARC